MTNVFVYFKLIAKTGLCSLFKLNQITLLT